MLRRLPARFSVDFEELDGSPTETITSEFWRGTSASRKFKVATRDRFQLIREFLGFQVGNTVYEPHAYTSISIYLVAQSVSTEPFGKISNAGDTRWADYDYCIISVTYGIPDEVFEAFGGLVTITETVTEATEFVTAPIKNLFWYVDGVDNEPIDEFDAVGRVNKLLEWTYEIRNARSVPSNIWDHYGKINNDAVYSRSLNTYWATGTLLCGSPSIVKESNYDGVIYNITLRFLIKNNGTFGSPRGWNYFPRISDETETDIVYEYMVNEQTASNDSTGWKIFYEPVDFSGLYVP